jgi:PPP family 3-phenylpropionic acid transporter
LPGDRYPVAATGLVIGAVFAVYGLQVPYFPLWLIERGLTPGQVAVVLSAPLLLRVVIAPLVGRLADGRADRRGLVIGLLLISLASGLALAVADGFWTMTLAAALMLATFHPVQPITDAVLGSLVRRGLVHDYGKLRLLGSASFALVAILGGLLLQRAGVGAVFGAHLLLLVLTAVAALALPGSGQGTAHGLAPPLDLPRRPRLALVLVATGLINASQAMYFSFGSVHMRAVGYPDWSIGWLWTVAVGAEIVVLWFSAGALRRFGVDRLLVLAAIGTLLRWVGMAVDPPLAGMLGLQMLHAATLSCTYLGLMGFIQRHVEEAATARAQSMAMTLTGVLTAVMTLATGPLYAALAGHTYLVMALLPALALVLLEGSRRRYGA